MSKISNDIFNAIIAINPAAASLKFERYEKVINDDGTVTLHIYAREESAITEAEVTIIVNP